jgi:hypothetical protein
MTCTCLRKERHQIFNVIIKMHILYKTFNDKVPNEEWINLNLLQINTSRQTTFITTLQKQYNVGYNILNNKFDSKNRQIPLEWFNKSLDSFNIACKDKFLKIN